MRRQTPLKRRRPGIAARTFTQAMLFIPVAAILGFAVWRVFLAPPLDQRMRDSFALKVGDRLPYVQVEGADGTSTTLGDMAQAGPLLVLLADEECPVCHSELEAVARTRPETGTGVGLVVLSVSKTELHDRLAGRYPGLTVVSDVNATMRERLNLPSVPAAVAVGPDRTVRDIQFGLQRAPDLRALVAGLQQQPAERTAARNEP